MTSEDIIDLVDDVKTVREWFLYYEQHDPLIMERFRLYLKAIHVPVIHESFLEILKTQDEMEEFLEVPEEYQANIPQKDELDQSDDSVFDSSEYSENEQIEEAPNPPLPSYLAPVSEQEQLDELWQQMEERDQVGDDPGPDDLWSVTDDESVLEALLSSPDELDFKHQQPDEADVDTDTDIDIQVDTDSSNDDDLGPEDPLSPSNNRMKNLDCTRCMAKKANGERCARTTCKYAHMCWQHTRYKKGLYIAPSRLGRRAGMGLFAFKPFTENQFICKYGGKKVKQDVYERSDSVYGVTLENGYVRDASSTQSGLGRWINECRDGDECQINCKMYYPPHQVGEFVSFYATRAIEKDDELYTTYGELFHQENEIELESD